MMKKTLFFALFIALAPVTLLADSPQPVKNPSIYIVKKGDCLWTISKRVWGDPAKWPMLFATNQGKIHNPNLIYAGQKFTIPTTITKEELEKATRLAEEKSAPIGVQVTGAEGTQVASHKKHKAPSLAQESAASSTTSKEAPAVPEKAAPPATTQESQPPAAAPESTGSSGMMITLLLSLVALVGGIFFWMRSRPSPSEVQAPRSLSSFTPTGEPGQRPSTPFSTSQAYPAPSQPAVSQSNPPVTPPQPAASPVDKPATYSGTMTSISTPSSPAPAASTPPAAQAPAQPATQLPLTPPVSAPPEVQAPPPSTPPVEGENKSSDTPPPSSSSNHAA